MTVEPAGQQNDRPSMAEQINPVTEHAGPTTVEGYLADRQHFWVSFTHFIVAGVVAVVAILLFLAWLTL